jgi:hypothetical protein
MFSLLCRYICLGECNLTRGTFSRTTADSPWYALYFKQNYFMNNCALCWKCIASNARMMNVWWIVKGVEESDYWVTFSTITEIYWRYWGNSQNICDTRYPVQVFEYRTSRIWSQNTSRSTITFGCHSFYFYQPRDAVWMEVLQNPVLFNFLKTCPLYLCYYISFFHIYPVQDLVESDTSLTYFEG